MRGARPFIGSLLLLAAVGCNDLDRFALAPNEVYAGTVAGIDDVECTGETPCSFIRRGFAEQATLEMDFDPERIGVVPGQLTSSDGGCGPEFANTELRNIAPLAHDQLALYNFPGGDRLRNYMYVSRPESGPLSSRDVMVFLSLLRSGEIELRVVAGAGQSDCAPTDCDARTRGECDYFGVFRLARTRR